MRLFDSVFVYSNVVGLNFMEEILRKKTTLAVLPFENLSSDSDLDYFFKGFVEDLITDFSRFKPLQVISHHSSEQVSSEKESKSLQADYLVKGSFRRQNENIRLQIKLIDTVENNVVFAGKHDETMEDLYQKQDEISEQIVSVIQQQINTDLLSSAVHKPLANLDAYVCFLKGMEELKKGSVQADNNAREMFVRAIEIDPNYARAYSGISLSYFNEWSCQYWEKWDESKKGAHDNALKAVELDENDYVALAVLGRTYCYLGEFDKAEYCVRRALRINPNDADNLSSISTTLTYLGFAEEAIQWLEKAINLNPFNNEWYHINGCLINLILGNYETSIDLGVKAGIRATWVDLPAMISASCWFADDLENMEKYWNKYLEGYQNKITPDEPISEAAALQWFIDINPFRKEENIHKFYEYMGSKVGKIEKTKSITSKTNSFVIKNGLLDFKYGTQQGLVPHVKGFNDLAILIENPGSSHHCMELMGAQMDSSGLEVIDEKAKKSYQKKVRELLEDIEEAKSSGNHEKTAHLQEEYDTLIDHLAGSLGLGGSIRKKGSTVEKARSAITWRIRSAIKKIEEANPEFGKHLSNSIKTGIVCSYQPEADIEWIVEVE